MPSLEDRFWAKVDRRGPDECWEWTGATDGRYGQIWFDGKNHKANRLALQWKLGRELLPTEHACHSCDNPLCVNPAHLWLGDMSKNIQDAVNKGRVVPPAKRGIFLPRGTHCRKGHLYDKTDSRGQQVCSVCKRATDARAQKRRTSKARAALGQIDRSASDI